MLIEKRAEDATYYRLLSDIYFIHCGSVHVCPKKGFMNYFFISIYLKNASLISDLLHKNVNICQ